MRKKLAENPYDAYRAHAVNNEIEIVSSKQCGCFFCRSIFDARKVSDWISDERGVTALCPECGMDAVLGDASGVPFDKPLLKSMNLTYYGMDAMANNPEALRVYCRRYAEGKITHKPYNESLFLRYMSLLADQDDEKANLVLAEFYEEGGEFTGADKAKALGYYKARCLSANSEALCNLGHLYQTEPGLGKDGPRLAFECYAKAAALGSLKAVYQMADCYLRGVFVDRDEYFASCLLLDGYDEVFPNFATSHKDYDVFPEFSYRLAKCYQNGLGAGVDQMRALRYYLITGLGLNVRSAVDGIDPNPALVKDIGRQVAALGSAAGYRSGDPIFDADTFYDTYAEDMTFDLTPKTFRLLSYNASEGEASFEITSTQAPLVCDLGDLYAAFISGTIRWEFKDVSMFRVSKQTTFEKIVLDKDENWLFVHVDSDGNEETIAEIRFFNRDPIHVSAKKPSGNDGE